MEEEYTPQENRIPTWALIAGAAVVFLCLVVLVTLFLARTRLLSIAVSVLASNTPTATNTLPPTNTFTPAPTATETPTLAPSETPTNTPVPMPPAGILSLSQGGPALEENFTDNQRNWIGISSNSDVIIQEQQLQLHSSETGAPAIGFCQGDQCGPFQDYYYYQAELVEDRPSTLALGMVFAINSSKTAWYNFAIRPSSAEFTLQKFLSGQWQTLVDWTSNPAIRFYPFANQVGVSYQGGTMQMFVNGVQVSSFTDKQPIKEGRVGFSVESDGVRLLAGKALVLSLAQVTPEPPGQPTAPPGAQGTQPSAYQSPTPGSKYTMTPTAPGACPAYVPAGNFVLVVFKTGQKRASIEINGAKTTIEFGNNVFYLPLKKHNIVVIGNKTHDLYYEVCKIVSLQYKQ